MSVKLGEVHRAEWIANGGNPQSEFLFWCDSKGRYADGHACRTTIVSLLAQSGISPKELQGLARHSDPKTTLRDYAKLSDTDLERAVKCLPDLAPQKKTSEEQLNVGQAFAVPSAVPLLCQKDDVQRMNLILNDASGKTAEIKKISGKTGFLAEKKKRALPDSNRGITVLQTVALPLGEGPFYIFMLGHQDSGSTVPDTQYL